MNRVNLIRCWIAFKEGVIGKNQCLSCVFRRDKLYVCRVTAQQRGRYRNLPAERSASAFVGGEQFLAVGQLTTDHQSFFCPPLCAIKHTGRLGYEAWRTVRLTVLYNQLSGSGTVFSVIRVSGCKAKQPRHQQQQYCRQAARDRMRVCPLRASTHEAEYLRRREETQSSARPWPVVLGFGIVLEC